MQQRIPKLFLILGFVYFMCRLLGPWNLNWTIGWEWGYISLVLQYILTGLWVFIFPLVYWLLVKRGYQLDRSFSILHLIVWAMIVSLSLIDSFFLMNVVEQYAPLLNLLLWPVFFIHIVAILVMGRKKASD